MRPHLILSSLLIFCISLKAQSGSDEWGTWYMYFGQARISQKLSICSLIMLNYWELNHNHNQSLFGAGINYHLSDRHKITAGYAYSEIDPSFEDSSPTSAFTDRLLENRIFEQFSYAHGGPNFKWSHRISLEHRFFNNLVTRTQEVKHRFRYRLQTIIPFKYCYGIINDEILANHRTNLYNQNRFFIGLGKAITKTSKLQLGYLNIDTYKANYNRIWISVSFNPDLRKKVRP